MPDTKEQELLDEFSSYLASKDESVSLGAKFKEISVKEAKKNRPKPVLKDWYRSALDQRRLSGGYAPPSAKPQVLPKQVDFQQVEKDSRDIYEYTRAAEEYDVYAIQRILNKQAETPTTGVNSTPSTIYPTTSSAIKNDAPVDAVIHGSTSAQQSPWAAPMTDAARAVLQKDLKTQQDREKYLAGFGITKPVYPVFDGKKQTYKEWSADKKAYDISLEEYKVIDDELKFSLWDSNNKNGPEGTPLGPNYEVLPDSYAIGWDDLGNPVYGVGYRGWIRKQNGLKEQWEKTKQEAVTLLEEKEYPAAGEFLMKGVLRASNLPEWVKLKWQNIWGGMVMLAEQIEIPFTAAEMLVEEKAKQDPELYGELTGAFETAAATTAAVTKMQMENVAGPDSNFWTRLGTTPGMTPFAGLSQFYTEETLEELPALGFVKAFDPVWQTGSLVTAMHAEAHVALGEAEATEFTWNDALAAGRAGYTSISNESIKQSIVAASRVNEIDGELAAVRLANPWAEIAGQLILDPMDRIGLVFTVLGKAVGVIPDFNKVKKMFTLPDHVAGTAALMGKIGKNADEVEAAAKTIEAISDVFVPGQVATNAKVAEKITKAQTTYGLFVLDKPSLRKNTLETIGELFYQIGRGTKNPQELAELLVTIARLHTRTGDAVLDAAEVAAAAEKLMHHKLYNMIVSNWGQEGGELLYRFLKSEDGLVTIKGIGSKYNYIKKADDLEIASERLLEILKNSVDATYVNLQKAENLTTLQKAAKAVEKATLNPVLWAKNKIFTPIYLGLNTANLTVDFIATGLTMLLDHGIAPFVSRGKFYKFADAEADLVKMLGKLPESVKEAYAVMGPQMSKTIKMPALKLSSEIQRRGTIRVMNKVVTEVMADFAKEGMIIPDLTKLTKAGFDNRFGSLIRAVLIKNKYDVGSLKRLQNVLEGGIEYNFFRSGAWIDEVDGALLRDLGLYDEVIDILESTQKNADDITPKLVTLFKEAVDDIADTAKLELPSLANLDPDDVPNWARAMFDVVTDGTLKKIDAADDAMMAGKIQGIEEVNRASSNVINTARAEARILATEAGLVNEYEAFLKTVDALDEVKNVDKLGEAASELTRRFTDIVRGVANDLYKTKEGNFDEILAPLFRASGTKPAFGSSTKQEAISSLWTFFWSQKDNYWGKFRDAKALGATTVYNKLNDWVFTNTGKSLTKTGSYVDELNSAVSWVQTHTGSAVLKSLEYRLSSVLRGAIAGNNKELAVRSILARFGLGGLIGPRKIEPEIMLKRLNEVLGENYSKLDDVPLERAVEGAKIIYAEQGLELGDLAKLELDHMLGNSNVVSIGTKPLTKILDDDIVTIYRGVPSGADITAGRGGSWTRSLERAREFGEDVYTKQVTGGEWKEAVKRTLAKPGIDEVLEAKAGELGIEEGIFAADFAVDAKPVDWVNSVIRKLTKGELPNANERDALVIFIYENGTDADIKLIDEINAMIRRANGPLSEEAKAETIKTILKVAQDINNRDPEKILDKAGDVTQALDSIYNGGTPSPGRLLSESKEAIRNLFRRVNDDGIKNFAKPTDTEITPKMAAAWDDFLGSLKANVAEARTIAVSYANKVKNLTFPNYGKKWGIDNLMSMVWPYPFWYTRTAGQWMLRSMTNQAPAMARYMRFKQTMAQQRADLPEYYRNALDISKVPGINSANPIWFQVDRWVMPADFIMDKRVYTDQYKRATWYGSVLDNLNQFGASTWVWWNVLTAVGMQNEYQETAEEKYRLGAERWGGRLIPQTGPLKNITSLLFGKGGVELDPFIHYFSGGVDPWQRDDTSRQLFAMYESGEISWAQYNDIAYNQEGPIWEEAVARGASEAAPQGLVGFFTSAGIRPMTQEDVQTRRLYQDLNKTFNMIENLPADEVLGVWDELRNQYPWIDAFLLSRKGGYERDRAFAYSVLARAEPGELDNLLEIAGIDYEQAQRFWEDKGDMRDWDKSDHMGFMAGVINISAVLDLPDQPTREEWNLAKSQYGTEVRDILTKAYGEDIHDKIDLYMSMRNINDPRSKDKADDFLNQHPEIGRALDDKAKIILNNDLLASYYGSYGTVVQYYDGVMYQYLDNKYGEDIHDKMTYYYNFLKMDEPELAKKYKNDHPEIQAYLDDKSGLRKITDGRIADFAKILPRGISSIVRKDTEDLTQKQQELKDYIQNYNIPELSFEQWVALMGQDVMDVVVQVGSGMKMTNEWRRMVVPYAKMFNVTPEEFISGVYRVRK